MRLKDFFWSSKPSVADQQRLADYKRLHAEGEELSKQVEEIHAKYGAKTVESK